MKLLIVFLFSIAAHARPEYALRVNQVNCTACHVSPVGGEIRTINGKNFGSHGNPLSTFSEKAQWFQLDYRAEAYQNMKNGTAKGAFVMTTVPAVNVPVVFEEGKPPEINFVASYGLGQLNTGLSSAYLRYNLAQETEHKYAEHLIVGRFLPPRGLQTDEHRTFTRLATMSSMRDYETGVMLSGTPSYYLHYDFAATNGANSGNPAPDNSPFAVYGAFRTIPYLGPVMLGGSYSRQGSSTLKTQPSAYDTYALFSVDKLSHGNIPIDLISEVEWARGWNNPLINSEGGGGIAYFIPQSQAAWQSSIADSRSRSMLLQAQYNLGEKWKFIARYEQFIPDLNFTGDKFNRIGVGAKWFFNGQSSLMARYEVGSCTRPGVDDSVSQNGSGLAIGRAAFVLLHFWL